MSRIKCKRCSKHQETTDLDTDHIYCDAHTGDEHEGGEGLVCLNVRSVRNKSGVCPDCGRIVTEYHKGQVETFRVKSTGERYDVLCY